MRYANGQEETLKNCMQRRVKAGHLPKHPLAAHRVKNRQGGLLALLFFNLGATHGQ